MASKEHKRSRSGFEDDEDKARKRARIEGILHPTDALGIANARIKELEIQIGQLHAYLDATGMTRKAPQSIRQHMEQHPQAARSLAAQIEAAAIKISDKLSEKTLNIKKTGVTSDDISSAMVPFLREVNDVRKLPNSAEIAFDLVMTLARYSYGELDGHGSGYGDRPSDAIVDDLLSDLAPERRDVDPSWDFVTVLDKLRKQADVLNQSGNEGFCTGSIALLSKWKDSLPSS